MKHSLWCLVVSFMVVSCQPGQSEKKQTQNHESNKQELTQSSDENKDENKKTETCIDEYLVAAQLLDQRNLNCGNIGRDDENDSTEGDVSDDDIAENVGRETVEQISTHGTELDNSIDELKQDSRTCDRMKKLNFPILIGGNAVTVNTAFAYRFGVKTWKALPLGDLPNRFRRTADLIFQAKNINGKDFIRTVRKINKKLEVDQTPDQIAKAIVQLDEAGELCKNNEFLTVTRVREILVDQFKSQK